ncbi:hypothetical protein IFR05_015720 [Cadophora sp. M221]|nr:hypothetical protein IFR05_015720 [Cadophora sp. M221]
MSSRASSKLSTCPPTSLFDGYSSPTPPNRTRYNGSTPVVTHMRPRRRRRSTTPPKTPSSSPPRRRRRRRRNISSSPPRLSTPYRGPSAPSASSPYVFDEDFYQNQGLFNNDITEQIATFGAETNRQKKHLRKAHQTIVESAEVEDGFEPIDVPERPLVAHLPDEVVIDDPASFFRMFFGEEQFEGFVENTNKYAIHWRTENPDTKRHTFKPVSTQEMKVYVALLVFIGYQGNGRCRR